MAAATVKALTTRIEVTFRFERKAPIHIVSKPAAKSGLSINMLGPREHYVAVDWPRRIKRDRSELNTYFVPARFRRAIARRHSNLWIRFWFAKAKAYAGSELKVMLECSRSCG